MLLEEEQAHNLLEADRLRGKLKHNTQLCVSGHQTGGRTLAKWKCTDKFIWQVERVGGDRQTL
jgi:hypothetical protein